MLGQEESTKIQYDSLILDLQAMQVLALGKEISLTSLETKLLHYFLLNPGKVISRVQLLESVWETTKVSYRTVDTHVASIRKKLSETDFEFVGIYGAGYMFRKRRYDGTDKPNHESDLGREFFANCLDLLGIIGFDEYLKEVNPGWQTMLGWSMEELCQSSIFEFVYPLDIPIAKSAFHRLLEGQSIQSVTCRLRHKDGSYRWLKWSATSSLQKELIFVIGRDITAIKEQELVFDEIKKTARIGTWRKDLRTGEIFRSCEIYDIMELPNGSEFTREVALNFLAVEDYDEIQRCLKKCIDHGTPYDVEAPMVTAKGRKIWVRAIGRAMVENGETKEVYGLFMDITQSKKRQLELERQTLLLNTIIDSIPYSVFVKNAEDNFKFILWNKKSEIVHNLPRDEVIGRTAHDLWPKEQADRFLSDDQAAMNSGEILEIAQEHSESRGRGTITVETRKIPLCSPSKLNPDLLLCLTNEISENKKYSEQDN